MRKGQALQTPLLSTVCSVTFFRFGSSRLISFGNCVVDENTQDVNKCTLSGIAVFTVSKDTREMLSNSQDIGSAVACNEYHRYCFIQAPADGMRLHTWRLFEMMAIT